MFSDCCAQAYSGMNKSDFVSSITLLISITLSMNLSAADQLDGISVTATRTERSLFDTPDTVSRVGQDEMERNQVQKLSDALKNIPGVSFSSGPRAIAEKPLIRGLGGNRILITVDGARQNFNSGHKGRVFVETELLKTVEVLRGPGSAVYGSGAMAGVIAMTTKDASDFLVPGETLGARIKTGYQNVNKDKLGTGILFGETTFAGGMDFILSGTRRSSEDIRLGDGENLENSAEDTWAILAKANWKPIEHQRFTFSRQYSFDSGEVPAQADARTSATAVLTDRETEVILDRLAYRYDNPGNKWLNLDTFIYNNDQTIREKRIGTDGRLDIIDFNTRGLDVKNSSDIKTGKNSGHRISYGIEYFQDKMNSTRGDGPNLAFPSATADFIGAYFQDEITLDSWILIPAIRYDKYKSQSDRVVVGATDSTRESQVSPKLGLIYKVTDWMNLSFNYGQAFRAPSFQELYISGVHFGANNFEPNANLIPEKLINGVEAGVRIRLKDMSKKGDRLSFRVSTYYNEYEDFIDSIVTTTVTSFDNISEARIHGVELETVHYTSQLDLESTLSASYSIGKNLTDDRPLSGIPGHSVTLNLQKYFIEPGLSFGLRGSFHLEQDRVAFSGQPVTKAYNLYDVYMTWTPFIEGVEDMQFIMGVDNVSDKFYKPHLSNLPGPGRNAKVSLIFQF